MRKIIIILMMILTLAFGSVSVFAKGVKVGDILPDFQMKDLQGKSVKVSDFRGQYVVYDVWATWCKYCIPVLEDYQKNLAMLEKAGIKIVAVSVDTKVDTVINYVKEKKWTFTITHDKTNNAGRIWGVTGIPAMFMVDPQGKVIYSHVGMTNFGEFWNAVNTAMGISKNPPVRVSQLKPGTYQGNTTNITSIYMNENLELDIQPHFFSSTVQNLKKEPKYEDKPKYATISIGEQVINLAVVKEKNSQVENILYIDFDGNMDITDADEKQEMEVGTDPNTGELISRWAGEMRVKIKEGLTMGYQLICFFGADFAEYYCIPLEGYQVDVPAGEDVVKSWIIDLNANGKFNDEADLILIDLNQNQEFDTLSGAEVFSLKKVLELKEGKYQINISELGKEINIKTLN